MAMCLQWGGVNRTTIWENLQSVYSFSMLTKEKLDSFINELIQNKFISMGEEAESLFGRKNFMEIYSVISSVQEYIYLKESSKEQLFLMRKDTGEFLKSSFAPMEIGEEGLTCWTYAGGKINNTIYG